MTTKATGGGSSAVAASAHAACERFRATDPLVTGVTRRRLATEVGFADASGGIPEARWMRAMTFERLVRDERFASEVATTTMGRLGLDRPTEVVIVNAHLNIETTASLLEAAHGRAIKQGAATMLHGLAVPFAGFEDVRATDVKPDFSVVARKLKSEGPGSWLVMGDAKDYERVRSRVEDTRLLKGFLQVALGAESAGSWSRLPGGMAVHSYGVLAVPRNAFLQPEALVEQLNDHRAEVRMRVAERRREAAGATFDESSDLTEFVAHRQATFDPVACTTCTLFSYCRNELRHSTDPTDLLIELGVRADLRPHLIGLVDGTGVIGRAPASAVASVTATLEGVVQSSGQLRVDPAGLPGTVNVVIAKSDAAALGVHGLALQRVTKQGRQPWTTTVLVEPQSSSTRRAVMHLLGRELSAAMTEMRKATLDSPSPVHLVVPDKATADVLVSIADNLAGVELSRLRWERDRQMGRKPLTFDGGEAQVPAALSESDRTAVSFLLEEDRARALTLRSPIVDVRAALARHVIAGGPEVSSLRLDYLTLWTRTNADHPLDHRVAADEIEASDHTPGARLTNRRSDAIHRALAGSKSQRRSPDGGPVDPVRYQALVTDELEYKARILETALDALGEMGDSKLREVHRAIEGDAQAVWRRRLTLHASDLVRFGRTYRHWRNSLVPAIESDGRFHTHLLAIGNPQAARDLATDAGTREVAYATVVSVAPLMLDVHSRRIGAGTRIVLLHIGDRVCAEDPAIDVIAQAGSFKFSGLSIGSLSQPTTDDSKLSGRFLWTPVNAPLLSEGDDLVIADFRWFSKLKGDRYLSVERPKSDDVSAPKPTCEPDSYDLNPTAHRYCCRPHEDSEADWSDQLALRRARGELNPEVWPPVRNGDAFEVAPSDAPSGDPAAQPSTPAPDDLTLDDLD